MDYLAFTLPNGETINPPTTVPTGGLEMVGTIIGNTIAILITVAIIVTLVNVAWAGSQWIMSEGDKNKIAAARKRITWGLIGMIIAMSVFGILNIIGYLFNVELLNFQF